MSILLDRQLERWYALIDIDVQVRLSEAVGNGVRFPVVPAGRRSGKTERAKRFVAKQAMKNADQKYFLSAPTQDQAKKIWFDDMCALTLSTTHERQPRVSPQPVIYMPNGTEIHIIGLDKPQRIEGINYTPGPVDALDSLRLV